MKQAEQQRQKREKQKAVREQEERQRQQEKRQQQQKRRPPDRRQETEFSPEQNLRQQEVYQTERVKEERQQPEDRRKQENRLKQENRQQLAEYRKQERQQQTEFRKEGSRQAAAERLDRALSSKRPDFVFSAGYSPLIRLYGDGEHEPLGFALRVGVLPLKRIWGYLGAEAGGFYNQENQESRMIGPQAALLYQLWLPNRLMVFNFRLGAGAQFFFGSGAETGQAVSLNVGASFQWHLTGPFFIESGVDFTHLVFTANASQSAGYLRPALNIGFQF
jgi:hypothetical protein